MLVSPVAVASPAPAPPACSALLQCGSQGCDVMVLRADEAMTRHPKTCGSEDMAIDAMQARNHQCSSSCANQWCLWGVPKGTSSTVLCGKRDCRHATSASPALPTHTLHLPQAMEAGPKVNMLPVVDDGRVQGLVTLHALVSAGL